MDCLMKISKVMPFGITKCCFDTSNSFSRRLYQGEDFRNRWPRLSSAFVVGIVVYFIYVHSHSVEMHWFSMVGTTVKEIRPSAFVAVTSKSWTICNGESTSLCLKVLDLSSDSDRVYCMYDMGIDSWLVGHNVSWMQKWQHSVRRWMWQIFCRNGGRCTYQNC